MKFNFIVVGDTGETLARFVNKRDADSFARNGESVQAEAVDMAFGTLSIPRKDIQGNLALNEGECIGVW